VPAALLSESAVLLVMVLLMLVAVPPRTTTPPPLPAALLPLMVVLMSVRLVPVAVELIAPPSIAEVLPVRVEFTMVSAPSLIMRAAVRQLNCRR
jgi:xanthosine utilization system XapX-like protein